MATYDPLKKKKKKGRKLYETPQPGASVTTAGGKTITRAPKAVRQAAQATPGAAVGRKQPTQRKGELRAVLADGAVKTMKTGRRGAGLPAGPSLKGVKPVGPPLETAPRPKPASTGLPAGPSLAGVKPLGPRLGAATPAAAVQPVQAPVSPSTVPPPAAVTTGVPGAPAPPGAAGVPPQADVGGAVAEAAKRDPTPSEQTQILRRLAVATDASSAQILAGIEQDYPDVDFTRRLKGPGDRAADLYRAWQGRAKAEAGRQAALVAAKAKVDAAKTAKEQAAAAEDLAKEQAAAKKARILAYNKDRGDQIAQSQSDRDVPTGEAVMQGVVDDIKAGVIERDQVTGALKTSLIQYEAGRSMYPDELGTTLTSAQREKMMEGAEYLIAGGTNKEEVRREDGTVDWLEVEVVAPKTYSELKKNYRRFTAKYKAIYDVSGMDPDEIDLAIKTIWSAALEAYGQEVRIQDSEGGKIRIANYWEQWKKHNPAAAKKIVDEKATKPVTINDMPLPDEGINGQGEFVEGDAQQMVEDGGARDLPEARQKVREFAEFAAHRQAEDDQKAAMAVAAQEEAAAAAPVDLGEEPLPEPLAEPFPSGPSLEGARAAGPPLEAEVQPKIERTPEEIAEFEKNLEGLSDESKNFVRHAAGVPLQQTRMNKLIEAVRAGTSINEPELAEVYESLTDAEKDEVARQLYVGAE